MFCSKCGKEIDDNAVFCQFCGNKVLKETTAEENSATQKEPDLSIHKPKQEESNTGCLPVFGVLLFIFFAFLLFSVTNEKPIEEDDTAQNSLARTLCQQAVEQRLKNPKSAEFYRSSSTATKLENMKYRVDSYVYAQNSFGGTVKSNFSCTVKLEDKESGRVLSLKID